MSATCGWSPPSLWVRLWWPSVASGNSVLFSGRVICIVTTRVWSQASDMATSWDIAPWIAWICARPSISG